MFGASNSGSSLFGSKPATGFGAAPAQSSGFSFGGNTNNNATNNTTTQPSTGLFGSSAAPSTAGSTSTGFSFGGNNNAGNNTAAPSGGMFGGFNNNASTTAPTTGGLFGAKPAAPTTGGMFGSSTTTPSTGGLFGSAATQPATGGLFGGQQQQQQQAQQQQPQQQQQQPQQQQQNSFTNTSSQPAFSWTQNSTQSQPQQQQPLSFLSTSQTPTATNTNNNNYSANIQEQLTKVKSSWDPTSQQTVLKTYFYNTVPENQTALYSKPSNEDEEWDKAFENKPTSNSIPVRAVGFEDLQKRAQTQVNHVAQSRNLLQQISEKYKILSDKHELDTASRIVAAKAKHTRISRRILRLVSTLAVLKSKGYQLSPSEEKLVEAFQSLLEKSQDPSGLGKTNELWARLAILKEKAKSLSEQLDNSLGIKNVDVNDELNDGEQTQAQVLEIAKVLQEQQNGIKYLNEVLEADNKTLEKLYK